VDWLDLAVGQKAGKLFRIEIGNADAFGQSKISQLLHGTPSVQVIDVTVIKYGVNLCGLRI